MLESKALEKSPILQSDQEPALPQATKRLRATLEPELDDETYNETLVTDNTSLPVIALDLDLETLRSMVKFIVSTLKSKRSLESHSFLTSDHYPFFFFPT